MLFTPKTYVRLMLYAFMFHESLSWLCKKLSRPEKNHKILNILGTIKINWAQKIEKDEEPADVSNIEKSAKNYLVWKF